MPCSSQKSGTTLVASPAWIMVTEMTAGSMGRLLRVMMVWNACTIWQATGTGSMPLCGIAACAPLPRMVILNSLLEANTGPGFDRKLARRQARPVVNAEDGFHRKELEQAILDHLARTAAAFLGRLEHQVDGAIEIAVRGQVFGGGQQHRGVAVVAAGVHLAGIARWRGRTVLCSVIGSASMSARRPTARLLLPFLTMPTTPGFAQTPMHRNAPVGQRPGDQVRGALLLEASSGCA